MQLNKEHSRPFVIIYPNFGFKAKHIVTLYWFGVY